MKRAFVFLLLSPIAVLFATALIVSIVFGANHSDAAFVFAMIVAVLTWPIPAIAAIFDAWMAEDMPIHFRAPVMAFIGAAMVACVIAFFLNGVPAPFLVFVAGGAVCVGVCSLAAHDSGTPRRSAVATAA